MRALSPPSIRAAFRGRLGGFTLDAAFTVPATGITGLFGPSGCGKSSVLRCLAGLQHLPGSSCDVSGEVWQDDTTFLKPHHRPIGYVFQEASLFQHLSVKANLLYGAPRHSGEARADAVGFDEVIDLLGLSKLLERSPRNLSGGERQRVAIGRALLSQPRLLLMDEPLSALDRLTKDEILPFLERLHARLSLPVIYVSHDITEIERLADHLVLMHSGKVLAVGPLAELQSDPKLPLAIARDAAVNFDATVESYDTDYGLLTLRIDGGRLLVPSPPAARGELRRVRIAASDVSLAREPPHASSILNALPARIASVSPIGGNEVLVVLTLGRDGDGGRLLARLSRRSWDLLRLAEGVDVYAQIKGVALAPGRDGHA
ncbi:molybdenum ABC transporter ATP-binding protein [Rhodopseudomonas palustris]|uniref:Molybdenum ABC transporter ATP-binding protein n=1 Tax=Rhodopseudomonas palustris TaxID=1076 RepID=A0A323UCF5_RHOPL|nr:molybdenum ABC transporter ATP-binding protein [Rhodopseudomonas palustris]PZA10535.1 molybdenum ABC transporter ATP-binding protein [Rhodopseudomonas palustris]